ncbi:LysR family transcriptional regulator [Pseudomaricurvus alkylphenolicus]|uniref:LysR family transcriptional regulator n=1 Tax=Pseudomaricurvus alkylphenolicus TaxID=1306991 RepID=UPI00141E8CE5|nr:LysR family transcriptional regulator [Pseudomaricurvus alkylphenolicus]NIB43502.1 LysR family transcriptional regulator [Pseudomaricurvus alkylphenolicus]
MDRLTAMSMFVRVAEAGSFSSVAKEMDTTQPTISKNIAELEKSLGAKLLNRSTRALHLTEAGADYYERCINILMDIDEAEQSVGQLQSQPKGTVRLAAPAAFGQLHVVPALAAFFKKYPDIKVELLLNDRNVDLVQEGVDLALRMGKLSDSSLIARRITKSPVVTVASPVFLTTYGQPQHPLELKNYSCIIFTGYGNANELHFFEQGNQITVHVDGNFLTNSSDAVRKALLTGHGISPAPRWLVGDALNAGELIEILQPYQLPPLAINAVYPSGRHLPSKARCLIDYLAERFSCCSNIGSAP